MINLFEGVKEEKKNFVILFEIALIETKKRKFFTYFFLNFMDSV